MSFSKRILVFLLLIACFPAGPLPAIEKNPDEPGQESPQRQTTDDREKLSREELEIIKMMELLKLMELLQDMEEITFLEKES